MKIAVFTTEAAAQAFCDLVSKALGYPYAGVDVGSGRHTPASNSQTVNHDYVFPHPVSGLWVVRIDRRVLWRRVDPYKLKSLLSASEITTFTQTVDSATDDSAIEGQDKEIPGQPLAIAARLVLLVDDGTGTGPKLPAGFTASSLFSIGDYIARQFERNSDGFRFVVQRIAAGGTPKRWLVVVWVPSSTRFPNASEFGDFTTAAGADIVKSWAVVAGAGGRLEVPSLDSDGTAIGVAVKGLWPSAWSTSGGAPRFIADVLE